jgi:hypothetical protein
VEQGLELLDCLSIGNEASHVDDCRGNQFAIPLAQKSHMFQLCSLSGLPLAIGNMISDYPCIFSDPQQTRSSQP